MTVTAGWARPLNTSDDLVHWWRPDGFRACIGADGPSYIGPKIPIDAVNAAEVCPECFTAVVIAAKVVGNPTERAERIPEPRSRRIRSLWVSEAEIWAMLPLGWTLLRVEGCNDPLGLRLIVEARDFDVTPPGATAEPVAGRWVGRFKPT